MDAFLGEIRLFGGNYAPSGWAFCNGQLLSLQSNVALYSLLGLTYGGDGKTTFGLPNLQGRVLVQPGQGVGLSDYELGQTGGTESETLTLGEMAQHTHAVYAVPDPAEGSGPSGNALARSKGITPYSTGSADTGLNSQVVAAQGSGSAHENRSPTLALNFIICLQGIYPPRG